MFKNIYFERVNKKNSYFLSDHCLSDPENLSMNSLKNFKSKLICKYHWDSQKKVKKDYIFLKRFLKKKTKEISLNLNKFHSMKENEKYWKIIILPWLTTITYILYDRWEMINSVKNKSFIFHSYKFNKAELIPKNFRDLRYVDENFNLMIYSLILDYTNKKTVKEKTLKLDKYQKNNFSIFDTLHSKLLKILSIFASNKIVFNNIGISLYEYIKLNLSYKQWPFIWIDPTYMEFEKNLKKRKKYLKKEKDNKAKNFENFFDQIIYLFIPKSYLEDFYSINNSIKKSYWPNNCKKIVTAYEYKLNDIFKIWCANMVRNKSKYFIIQHGGSFGTAEYLLEEDYQKEIADKFLSWGWNDKYFKNVVKFNAFQFNFFEKRKTNNENEILICSHFHSKFSSKISSLPKTNYDRLFKLYQIVKFIENLNTNSNIRIRYQKYTEKFWNFKFNEKLFPNYVKFDHGEKNLQKIINNYKIIVHDNDSTAFLLSMYMNKPSILILNKKFERFRKISKQFYKSFEKKGIIFYDPKKAANFLNKIQNNIDNWWLDKSLQKLRSKFCFQFAKFSSNPTNDLQKIIF